MSLIGKYDPPPRVMKLKRRAEDARDNGQLDASVLEEKYRRAAARAHRKWERAGGGQLEPGCKVRKLARRGHRGSNTLGTVTELLEIRGKIMARVVSGNTNVSTVWPVRRLEIVSEEAK